MRPVLLICALLAPGCHKSEFDETLGWMDNTYKKHEKISGAYGHGEYKWYTPDRSALNGERLANGSSGSFTYKGCQLAYDRDPAICPVRNLQARIESAGIESGPLFRSMKSPSFPGGREVSLHHLCLLYSAA